MSGSDELRPNHSTHGRSADSCAHGSSRNPFPVILLVLAPLVNHIEQTLPIDGHVVGRLPGVSVRQLRPVVEHFIPMFAFADDPLLLGLLGGQKTPGHGHGRRGGDGGPPDQTSDDWRESSAGMQIRRGS